MRAVTAQIPQQSPNVPPSTATAVPSTAPVSPSRKQLLAQIAKLQQARIQLQSGLGQLTTADAQLRTALASLRAGIPKLEQAIRKIDDGLAKAQTQRTKLHKQNQHHYHSPSAPTLMLIAHYRVYSHQIRSCCDNHRTSVGLVVQLATVGEVVAEGATLATIRERASTTFTTCVTNPVASDLSRSQASVQALDGGRSATGAVVTLIGDRADYPPTSFATTRCT